MTMLVTLNDSEVTEAIDGFLSSKGLARTSIPVLRRPFFSNNAFEMDVETKAAREVAPIPRPCARLDAPPFDGSGRALYAFVLRFFPAGCRMKAWEDLTDDEATFYAASACRIALAEREPVQRRPSSDKSEAKDDVPADMLIRLTHQTPMGRF